MRYSILNNICVSLVKWIEQVPPKRKPRHSPKGKMKNNFQFESILKNAKGDNKAFPKLGNVLMLPNQKICRLTTRKRVDNLIYGRREKSQKPSKIKGLRHVSS